MNDKEQAAAKKRIASLMDALGMQIDASGKCDVKPESKMGVMLQHMRATHAAEAAKTKLHAIPDLERMVETGCGIPGCNEVHDEIFIMQRCHPRTGLDVSYTKGSGEIKITCRTCGAPVSRIGVALI